MPINPEGADDAVHEAFVDLARSIEGSSVVFAAVFKEALRNKELSTVRGLTISQSLGGTLSKEDMEQMCTISRCNNAVLYPSHFRVLMDDAFETTLTNPKARFYLLRINNQIEGFARFEDMGPGKKYFGSFNMSPTLESFKLGGRFMEEVLAEEGVDSKVSLLVTHNNPFRDAHSDKYGFEIVETIADFDLGTRQSSPTGITVYRMERAPRSAPIDAAFLPTYHGESSHFRQIAQLASS